MESGIYQLAVGFQRQNLLGSEFKGRLLTGRHQFHIRPHDIRDDIPTKEEKHEMKKAGIKLHDVDAVKAFLDDKKKKEAEAKAKADAEAAAAAAKKEA